MGLLEDAPVVYYYLNQKNRRDPYDKNGPYDLDTMALLYKEEHIDRSTVVWTNDKYRPRGKFIKTRARGWMRFGDLPEELQERIRVRSNQLAARPMGPASVPPPSMQPAAAPYAMPPPPMAGQHDPYQQQYPGGYAAAPGAAPPNMYQQPPPPPMH